MTVPLSVVERRERSVFEQKSVKAFQEEVRAIYLADNRPWVVGYSGGKDSTATLQLVWYSLAELPPEQRKKPVHVIASDTFVETPVIVDHIDENLEAVNRAAKEQGMPFEAHKVTPEIKDTFWVNLIGRGYPPPSTKFRWCTDRMKIQPANKFQSGGRKGSWSWCQTDQSLGSHATSSHVPGARTIPARSTRGSKAAASSRHRSRLSSIWATQER